LGGREPVRSEDWVLERADHGTLGLHLRLIDIGALPQAEYPLSLGISPTRADVARAIADHTPRHVAYDLARKIPDEWVSHRPPGS